jgi:hypothetical protein
MLFAMFASQLSRCHISQTPIQSIFHVRSESDFSPPWFLRSHQLANRGKYAHYRLVVRCKLALEAVELARQGLVGFKQPSDFVSEPSV